MKRLIKRILGVTLLEIMLVLAVAAMIIIMSVRYYQSASTSQQANAAISQIQAIAAAMDSMTHGTGNYTGISGTTISSVIGPNGLDLPWGGTVVIEPSATDYTVTMTAAPAGVCTIVTNQFLGSSVWLAGCGSAGSGTLTAVYSPSAS